MNIEPAYKTHSRFVLALAVVVLGFAAYALHLVRSTIDEATVEQIRLQRKEQLAADFVAKVAASAWRARAAVVADLASNTEQREMLAEDTQLDVQTSLAMQESISDDLASTKEKETLMRVLDRRATMVSARDNVIQLRNAGEELRANFEFSERFLPSLKALEDSLLRFKVQQREALSAATIRVQELARLTERTLDVVFAFALTLAGLTAYTSLRGVGIEGLTLAWRQAQSKSAHVAAKKITPIAAKIPDSLSVQLATESERRNQQPTSSHVDFSTRPIPTRTEPAKTTDSAEESAAHGNRLETLPS